MSLSDAAADSLVRAGAYKGGWAAVLRVAWDLLDNRHKMALMTHPAVVSVLHEAGEEVPSKDQYLSYLDEQAVEDARSLVDAAGQYFGRPYTWGTAQIRAENHQLRNRLIACIRTVSPWVESGRITEPCRDLIGSVLADIEERFRKDP